MSYGNNYVENDEIIARALQEEYEREYRRRSMRQHLRQSQDNRSHDNRSTLNPGSAPTANDWRVSQRGNDCVRISDLTPAQPEALEFGVPRRESQRRSEHGRSAKRNTHEGPGESTRVGAPHGRSVNSGNNISSTGSRSVRPGSAVTGDGFAETTLNPRLADLSDDVASRKRERRVEPGEFETRKSRTSSLRDTRQSQPTSARQSNIIIPSVPVDTRSRQTSGSSNIPSTGAVIVSSGRALSDEELARRIAQEEEDAALARSISNEVTLQGVAIAGPPPSKCSLISRKLCSLSLSLGMLALAVYLMWFYFGATNNLPDFIPDPEVFREEDPFTNLDPDLSTRWRNNGQGLELTLINALDVSWNDYFYQAVSDWDSGTPDSLSLTTQTGTPESVCKAETGFLKVCNGDYGATNWRGINKVLLENDYIYASAARMNEFYFTGSDADQRQYTMCHEIGHGFGLPHTDENFYNRDLGNCMDYTNNPKNNKAPDDSNFIFLAELYGSLDGLYTSPPEPAGGAVEANESVPDINAASHEPEPDSQVGKEHGDGRRLRSNTSPDIDAIAKRQRMLQLSSQMDRLVDAMSKDGSNDLEPGWRRLRESEHAEEYEVNLGDGYRIKYHLLLVS